MRAALLPFISFSIALKQLIRKQVILEQAVLKRTVLKPVVLVPLLAATLLPGCAANRPDTGKLDCAALKQVIDTARTDLSGLTASRTNTPYGSVWRTKVAAYGSDCTMVGTANVPNRYFCTIPAAADSKVLSALQEDVASCLGSEWQRNPAAGHSGERFSRPGDNVVVDVGASDAAASRAEVIGLLVRRLQP